MNEIVFCPLLNKEVDHDGECFDIAMVAEGGSTYSELPNDFIKVENWEEICNNCPNHLD